MNVTKYTIGILCLILLFGMTGCGPQEAAPGPNPLPTITKDGDTMIHQKAPVLTEESLVYNIEDFGGAGDGRTDNSYAIQEAVRYVAAAGGGTIFFPKGNYKINSSIRIDEASTGIVTLAGDPDRSRESVLQSGTAKEGDWIVVDCPNIHLSYLSLEHRGEEGAVLKLASEKSVVTECSFSQTNSENSDTAVVVSGSDNYVGSCYFGPGTTNGYIFRFTKEPGQEAKNNILADSYFGGNLPRSVRIDTQDPDGCPQQVSILRNVFLFPAPGQVTLEAVDGCIIWNNMLDAATTAILLNPGSKGIRNVDIRYNYMGSQNTGITGYENRTDQPGGVVTDTAGGGTASNVVITDNYFWGYYGIRLTSPRFTDFTIVNNYFVESNGASLFITDSIRNRIEGNIFYCGGAAEYCFYIGKTDDETTIRYNSISGKYQIPNAEQYQQDNFFG